ncbi:DUF2281 domain-containing protein [Deferrisoma camini]|uniref:DUF2281 domain-containing protein n=1 Tax=Deferrisoma camini TaxID=1035120 RepID=UPI0038B34374
MGAVRREIDRLLEGLPPEQQEEVLRFVRRLTTARPSPGSTRPSFSWAGALKATDRGKTSVELQHEALVVRLGTHGTPS